MAINTNLPTDRLSTWYFAVRWGKYHIEQSIERSKESGFNPTYDEHQLKHLEELEQFLKMTWDEWMQDLLPAQTDAEVSRGV